MNDNHGRIAAGLHIAVAVFDLLVLAVAGVFFGGLAALAGLTSDADAATAVGFVAGFLGAITVLLAAFSIAQLVAGILFLRGSAGARPWLVVISAFMLLHFPLGTALGAYSLWALLRPDALPKGQP